MCLDILFHIFYLATLSFRIGFVIGFWNLQWSWICLCRSSHLRGVLENRCSQICSQNPWKIPMKFIFSKVAGWQCATFSCIPWGFYLIKKFVKIVFFAFFFLRSKLLGMRLCNFTKMNFFKDIFWGCRLKISLGNFQNICLFIRTSFFPEHLCGCFWTLFGSIRLPFILCF